MPFEGEFAGYKPLQRIAESERVLQLLRRARILDQASASNSLIALGGEPLARIGEESSVGKTTYLGETTPEA